MTPWTPERREQATTLFLAGLDNNEIARAVGLTASQVSPALARFGLRRAEPNLQQHVTSPNTRLNMKARKYRRGSVRPRPGCKPLWLREPGECAWPFGEMPDIVFCCKPVADRNGKRTCYCEEHLLKMWRRKEETDAAK